MVMNRERKWRMAENNVHGQPIRSTPSEKSAINEGFFGFVIAAPDCVKTVSRRDSPWLRSKETDCMQPSGMKRPS